MSKTKKIFGSAWERILSRIEVDDAGCWNWTAALDKDGYGRMQYKGAWSLAHRVAMQERGHSVAGLHVDHLCRNRACCNPEHLEVVTPAENNRRMNRDTFAQRRAARGASPSPTVCPHGHELNEANLYVTTTPSGSRTWTCRPCNAVASARASARRAAAS